jgi:type VI secretion system secreted protein VgrG
MVNVTGQAQTKISGAMAEVSGSGMLTLKGGITMIN